LPSGLVAIYEETVLAISTEMPILAALGIRTLIEAVCKERVAPGKSLDERISSLVPMGIVTLDGSKMLHSLRILGNTAAHEVRPASLDQLKAAFAIVNHMLAGTYILPKITEGLFPSQSKEV